jgi:hypothetical protein
MGLHDEIKSACAKATPAIARAAEGSEASIYNLRFAVADLMVTLVKDGSVIDALKSKGIEVLVHTPTPEKYA